MGNVPQNLRTRRLSRPLKSKILLLSHSQTMRYRGATFVLLHIPLLLRPRTLCFPWLPLKTVGAIVSIWELGRGARPAALYCHRLLDKLPAAAIEEHPYPFLLPRSICQFLQVRAIHRLRVLEYVYHPMFVPMPWLF